MKLSENFFFDVTIAGKLLAESSALWFPNADASGNFLLLARTRSLEGPAKDACTAHSLTAYTAQGHVSGFSVRYGDGKWVRYQIDASGYRVLWSSFGEPVSTSGPAICTILEHNNIAALVLLMRMASSQLAPGERKACAVLLPELNRTTELQLVRQADEVLCETLGLRYAPPLHGRAESLQFVESRALLRQRQKPDEAELVEEGLALAELQRQLGSDVYRSSSPTSIRFSDCLAAAGADTPPLAALFTPAVGTSRGLFVLIGGSGEYDSRGYTRLGENLGYRHWITHMALHGLDVLSVGRTNDAAMDFEVYRTALLRLISLHRPIQTRALVLAGHSLGGLVVADIAPDMHGLAAVVIAACPARGLRKTILRQSFAQSLSPCRSAQPRDRTVLRQQAQAFDRLIHGEASSPAAELRRGDRALITHFAECQAPLLLERWPANTPLLIMHADGDEKVNISDAHRWHTAAVKKGLRAESYLLQGKDHVFGLMAPEADPAEVLNSVTDFLRGPLSTWRAPS
ncbi:alpha/beta hydrolase [Hydrogenophaga crocea]|uniref:Alpha/beta fold hydrolase n=1 Tax=Hydrogenophaga crocea TaxID=2716225 RepID=A0A6G8IHI4_9BURK|nr:alpha/beta fold hydrolase [Hydrogenophaga crocea]QIM52495.1 alpha/beta fold hydrolase [Hydrogenophaga crocea]